MTEPDIIVEAVPENTEAPVTLALPCTRDSLLKPPDWRYQEALRFLVDASTGNMQCIPADRVVQYLIRGLRGLHKAMPVRRSPKLPERVAAVSRFMEHSWRVLREVIHWGVDARKSAMASMLDTCLIKGWTHDEALMAGCPVTKEVYDLYALAFFDLTGVRAVHSWIQDNLFAPEQHKGGSSALLRSRMLAYFGSGKSGVNSAVSGMMLANESSIISELIKNERQKKLFDYVVSETSLAPDVYAGIMETALKTMSDQEFQERMKDRDEASSQSLEDMTVNLEQGIRAYSQSELAHYDPTGLDATNKYISVITKAKNE